MLERPAFNQVLGDPLKLIPMPESLDLDVSRTVYSNYTADTILARFPSLEHAEYQVSSDSTDITDEPIIISIFKSKTTSTVRHPAVYHIHGGGQFFGNRFLGFENVIGYFDSIELDPVFVTVEYRLAPEFPAPAGLEDCYLGLVWLFEHSIEFNIDQDKILICGTSGGGALATASAMLARDRSYPKLCAQMLLTPMLDDRNQTTSAQQFERGTLWCGITNKMAWAHVVGDQDPVSELTAPARATNLKDLPPTYIDVGECEVFRDEVVLYA